MTDEELEVELDYALRELRDIPPEQMIPTRLADNLPEKRVLKLTPETPQTRGN